MKPFKQLFEQKQTEFETEYPGKDKKYPKNRKKRNKLILTPEMLKDYNEIEKEHGWKSILSRKWNISYQNVDRIYIKFKNEETI